jgi:hypothetical protein
MELINSNKEIENYLLKEIVSELKTNEKFIYGLTDEDKGTLRGDVLIRSNDKRFGFSKTGFWIEYTEKGLWNEKKCKNFLSPNVIKELLDGGNFRGINKRNFETVDFNLLKTLYNIYFEYFDRINDYRISILKKIDEEQKQNEEKRIQDLKISQNNILSELDEDGNGEVDLIEGDDFNTLLKKHQKIIMDIDRNYLQQFVKISSYLKTKKENIQFIFNSLKDTHNKKELNEYVDLLKGDIHVYNLLLFNSLNMIVSLVEDDMITFYEIHERFDNLNIFDSKHEKDVSQRLRNIGNGLERLMYEIRDMGDRIESSINDLSYVTFESSKMLDDRLSEIDSSIKTNNLLTLINTYQTYKINKNTKSLRG